MVVTLPHLNVGSFAVWLCGRRRFPQVAETNNMLQALRMLLKPGGRDGEIHHFGAFIELPCGQMLLEHRWREFGTLKCRQTARRR